MAGLKKYSVIENYFNCISSPEQAYLLGYFVADGSMHINPAKSLYKVEFTSIDYERIDFIRKILSPTRPLYEDRRRSKTAFSLSFNSKQMCLDLKELGYDSNKSQSAIYPDINSRLHTHFIRGVYDGDGCITRKSNYKYPRYFPYVTIVGTHSLLKVINDITPNRWSFKQYNGLWRLATQSIQAFSFLDWIYEHSENLRMIRKYDRYLSAQSETEFFLPKW